MPHTVPNKPTKGAVDPTVASTAKPSCRRLCTVLMARWMLMVTQVLKSTEPSKPPCLEAPSRPFSAMNRKGLAGSSASVAWRTEPEFQKSACAALANFCILACAVNLLKITYQLPMLMSTKISRVPLATASPCAHKAPRP